MGDRCYMRLEFRECDKALVIEHLGVEENYFEATDRPGIFEVVEEQADGGLTDAREALAEAGVPFIGWHGAGEQYDSFEFAAADGVMVEAPCLYDSGPVVTLTQVGQIDPISLKIARDYFTTLRKAEALLGRKPTPLPVNGGGSDIHAKGRNGYFKVHTVEACILGSTPRTQEGEKEVHVEVYSKRRGSAAPIRLYGPKTAISQLLRELADGIDASPRDENYHLVQLPMDSVGG